MFVIEQNIAFSRRTSLHCHRQPCAHAATIYDLTTSSFSASTTTRNGIRPVK